MTLVAIPIRRPGSPEGRNRETPSKPSNSLRATKPALPRSAVGGRFAVGGARTEEAVARVLGVLGNARRTEADVRKRAGGDQSLIGSALREAHRRGLIERDGPGGRAGPYWYALALVDAQATPLLRAAWHRLEPDDRARLRADAETGFTRKGDFLSDCAAKYLRAIETIEAAHA